MKSNLAIVVAIVVVVVLVGGILYWRSLTPSPAATGVSTGTPSGSAPTAGNSAPVAKVEITQVPTATLPTGFPSDVPIEAGATITLNFQGTNAAGEYQASREFISAKTADANFKYYQEVLKSGGWTVTNAIDDTARSQKIILATKGASSLNIRIYPSQGKVHVSINNITAK